MTYEDVKRQRVNTEKRFWLCFINLFFILTAAYFILNVKNALGFKWYFIVFTQNADVIIERGGSCYDIGALLIVIVHPKNKYYYSIYENFELFIYY